MMRSLDQLNGNDLSTLLANVASNSSNGAVLPQSLLLAAGTQQSNGGIAASVSPLTSVSSNSNQSQQAVLLNALLQHKREEQQKAALLQQISALTAPAASRGTIDNLALLLQQKQLEANAAANNPLALLSGASLGGVSAGFNALGSTSQGSLEAQLAAFKLLQSQKQQVGVPLKKQAPEEPPAVASVSGLHHGSSLFSEATMFGASSLGASAERRRKGRTGTFPQKLHQMLSDLERQDGGTDIASFLPHGRAFAIHKPRDFVKHVMPKYFRMSRFSSFQRQLNLYDFQRITEGPDKGSYYHELFVQGRPILSTMMKRNKIKGVKNAKAEEKTAQNDSSQRNDEAGDDESVDE